MTDQGYMRKTIKIGKSKGESLASYIEPNFRITSSYDKLQELYRDDSLYVFDRSSDDKYRISIGEILDHKLIFIVAEPGQGKSRLIKELEKRASAASKKVYRCELKTKTDDSGISQWLALKGVPEDAEVILLDGLDEASAKTINSTIYSLVDYVKSHPKTSFYISSRIHYFTKYYYNFSELSSAEFLLIKPLDRSKARAFLRDRNIQQGVIEKLFSSLQFGERVSVLQNPRYLEMIVEELSRQAFDSGNLNRASLFEAFINGALGVEDQNAMSQIAEYKKRLLELLALTMEIAQIKEITADDFVTFMERAKSDAKIIAAQVGIESIYEHSLLNKDVYGKITFTNTEVQEYLAAQYLMRMANPERKVFSVAVEPNLREVIPTWRNTLSFIIDELPRVARGIVDLNFNRLILDESMAELVTGCTSGKMSDDDKQCIFDYVWKNNEARQHPIGRGVVLNLANYANEERVNDFANKLIHARLSPKQSNGLLNIIRLCDDLLLLDRYSVGVKQKIRSKLLKLAHQSNDSVIRASALHALGSLGSADILQEVVALSDVEDDHIFGALESLAYNIDRNGTISIDIFIKGMKRSDLYMARRGLEEIDTVESIRYFLDKLASDAELIKAVIDHDRLFAKEKSQFMRNIERLWQDGWLDPLKRFVLLAFTVDGGYYASRSTFIDKIVKLLSEKDPSYYTELLNSSIMDRGGHLLVRIDGILAKIMQPKDVPPTVQAYGQMGDKGFLVFRIFDYVLNSESPHKREIRTMLRELLPDQLRDHDKMMRKFKRQRKNNSATALFQKVYAEIDEQKELGNYKPLGEAVQMLIQYLGDSSPQKEPLDYDEEQIEHIWKLLKEVVLERFDTNKIELKINERLNGNTNFTITMYARWYEEAVVFGHLTGRRDLGKYKDNLIALFPYMMDYRKDELFSSLDLTKEDELKIVAAYKDVKSDRAQFQPENFIRLVDRCKIIEAVDTLREFVHVANINIYNRVEALRVAEQLKPDKSFLIEVRGRYEHDSSSDSAALLRLIDSLLITNYRDDEAINRRFTLIRDSASIIPTHPMGVVHSISDDEAELSDKELAKPLMELRDRKYIAAFLELLDFSFVLNAKGNGWYRYAVYLWEVADAYFGNLSVTKDVKILQMIQDHVNDHPADATAYYLRRYNALTQQYLEQIGGKKPYINAINIVNKINTSDELEITTDEELLYEVRDLISELERWVQQEGFDLTKAGEVAAQPNIALRFENILLKKFDRFDVRVDRETQATDGTRTDFYVYFGFIGPVIIELKLSKHQDLTGGQQNKESYASMEKYMKQFNAKYGILLVYKTASMEGETFDMLISRTKKAYEHIIGVSVMGIRGKPSS